MKKLSIAEYEQLTGVPNRTIRYWIKAGKLPATKEIVNNRKITMISVDENELKNEIASKNDQLAKGAVASNKEQNNFLHSNNFENLPKGINLQQLGDFTNMVQQTTDIVSATPVNNITTPSDNSTVTETENIDSSTQSQLLELLNRMYEDNKYLAEAAGQTKLLTDSEHRTREEYFKLVQENKMLIDNKAELKAKLDLKDQQLKELQEKLKQQEYSKNNNWWSKL